MSVMSETTIICPRCGSAIPLTESFAAPMLAKARLEFEQKLSQKEEGFSEREKILRDQEKDLTAAQGELDAKVQEQVSSTIATELERIKVEEFIKA